MSVSSEDVSNRLQLQKLEIDRVLRSFKLDPYDVLNIPYTCDDSGLSRAYRNVSLQVHPDRCPPSLKIDAQNAFAKLGQAKEDMANEEKKAELLVLIKMGRERTDEYVKEWRKKRFKELKKLGKSLKEEEIELDFDEDKRWRNEVKEVIIEHEWKRRKSIIQGREMKAEAIADTEFRKKRALDEMKFDIEWEESRDIRINSWKNFQSSAELKRKKPKLPKSVVPVVSSQIDKKEKSKF